MFTTDFCDLNVRKTKAMQMVDGYKWEMVLKAKIQKTRPEEDQT